MKAAILVLSIALPLMAQDPASLLEAGAAAARAGRHAAAIEAWEKAIAASPELRPELLPSLARQYLWSEQSTRAVALLAEHLAAHPGDCAARNDYGLALAWSGRLDEAQEVYRAVAAGCPEQRIDALLREAMVFRWEDRPSRAEDRYRAVLADGPSRDAELGLGYVDLMRDRNRDALAAFRRLDDAEGTALALTRLGDGEAAVEAIAAADVPGAALSRDLQALRTHYEWLDRPAVEATVRAFRDADGTESWMVEGGGSVGWDLRGRARLLAGRSRLSAESRAIDGTGIRAEGEHRWSPALAARLTIGVADYDTGWRPVSGEAHLIVTPSDDLRVDVTAARILVTDNLAAVDAELEGDFLSAGADVRVSDAVTLAAAVDRTSWSEGNRRWRVIASPRWQLEGRPRITLEWPTVLQRYDAPFAFGLFSPRRYVETGPGVNAYLRFARVWNASAYVRAGAQKESGRSWDPLGTVRLAVWRDLSDAWALRASAGWSSSNLAGPAGFERTSVSLDLIRKFR